jgi:L-arabinose isomerase
MKNLEAPEIWYITGSHHLHGEATLNSVAAHADGLGHTETGRSAWSSIVFEFPIPSLPH